jgi:hypothetical protein
MNLTQSAGDGYATDANIVKTYNISDPSAFLKTLLIRPYINQARPLPQSPVHAWVLPAGPVQCCRNPGQPSASWEFSIVLDSWQS